jgi:hypothetical protein
MDSRGEARRELRPKLAAAALFLCTAVIVAVMFLVSPHGLLALLDDYHVAGFAALASPLVLLCACVLVFRRPRLGYGLGLVAGLMTLPWFVWSERLLYGSFSSWVSLNLVGEWLKEERQFVVFSELKILSVLLIVIVTACSALRLLPQRWSLRNSPLCRRTWPAFAVGLLVLAAWWGHSAMPYRIPYIVDAVAPRVRILHVEKHGFCFHETLITAQRDGRFYVGRDDRRLFQYRFHTQSVRGVLSQTAYDHTMAFVGSSELWKLHNAPAVALRSWSAEGWYVVLRDERLFTFTTEYKTSPPQEVTDLFHEIENLPGTTEQPGTVQDVSLGFGYGPASALGFWFSNQACFVLTGPTTQCR